MKINYFSFATFYNLCFTLFLSLILSVTGASAQNIAPTAVIGTDPLNAQNGVDGGITVILDGRDSFDPDGDDADLTYQWSQYDNATGFVDVGTDATYEFTTPVRTLLEQTLGAFQLIVSDPNDGISAPVFISITVLALVNRAPIANAGIDQDVFVGESITLDGSGSTDP